MHHPLRIQGTARPLRLVWCRTRDLVRREVASRRTRRFGSCSAHSIATRSSSGRGDSGSNLHSSHFSACRAMLRTRGTGSFSSSSSAGTQASSPSQSSECALVAHLRIWMPQAAHGLLDYLFQATSTREFPGAFLSSKPDFHEQGATASALPLTPANLRSSSKVR